MKIDEKLVYLRKQKGLSQMDLAENLHVSRQAVSRWEGGLAVPSTDNLKFLSELYNVSVDVLLNDNMNPPGKDDFTSDTTKNMHGKWSKQVAVVVFILMLIATALICIALPHKEENNEIIPMEEMESDKDDNLPSEKFSVGW